MMDAHEARSFLEAKKLPELLEQFVLDCARERPDDLLKHMSDWALRRRGSRIEAMKSTFILGSEVAQNTLFGLLNSRLCTTNGPFGIDDDLLRAELRGHGSSPVIIVRPKRGSAVAAKLRGLALSDAALFVVAPSDLRELSQRRESTVAQDIILAHATGLRFIMVAFVGMVTPTEQTAVLEVVASCGFDASKVTIAVVDQEKPNAAISDIARQLKCTEAAAPGRRSNAAQVCDSVEVTVMVLRGGEEGLRAGPERLLAYCGGACFVVIDSILCSADRRTGKVIDRNLNSLPTGSVGTLKARLFASPTGAPAATWRDAPFAILDGRGFVLAVGTVTLANSVDSASSASSAEVLDLIHESSTEVDSKSDASFKIDD